MKKYISFFRLRFVTGIQYRAAAAAGVATQFAWGLMYVLIFWAFYESGSERFPMTFSATASYIWLQQAFLALFRPWFLEKEILTMIENGNLSYELCRPIRLYPMWFVRNLAYRTSVAALRCMPILVVTAFLPEPLGIAAPASGKHLILFLIALILGLLVNVSLCMLDYICCLFMISAQGINFLSLAIVEFCSGAVVPIPFFPESMQKVLELLPFAAIQNTALQIYSGSISGAEIGRAMGLQVFWLVVLVLIGSLICRRAERRIVVQGG